jgi:phosphate starvation-inducible PhoH-like protein
LNTPVNLPRARASELVLEPFDNARLANLCGQFDEHLRQMEQRLGVEINNRGNVFRILGTPDATKAAATLLEKLYALTTQGSLTPSTVHLHLQATAMDEESETHGDDSLAVRTRRIMVRPRGVNQRMYLQAIRGNDISFGVGPAGTGKTYLAVACAVEALEAERVRRLVLVRPAVEAGERLGFLPGDMSQKVDPYLRPLYDALFEMLGFERVGKLIERGVIEVAPLAFMRGRTLNEAFIILDEGQNTTVDQMKMFLTRIGFGSTAVVTGDITQVDLPRDRPSGLRQVLDVLNGTEGISFTFFRSKDVVRHPVVARILDAYDQFDHGSGY